MKKNIFKTITLLFCMALCLSGCATVSNITNQDGSKIYYDDVQYFQGQVALIGDYLYYGNGYTASDGDDFNYNDAASTGYLARLYVGENLQYGHWYNYRGIHNRSSCQASVLRSGSPYNRGLCRS